eukprot:9227867-Prorocentrum_lima.AAC.1
MEKEDLVARLSDKAHEVWLLQKCGLTREEMKQVLASTGAKCGTELLKTALLQMFRDASKSDGARRSALR